MKLLVNDPRAAGWLSERVKSFQTSPLDHTIAGERGGQIVVCCLYRNFFGDDIEMVIAADNTGPLFGPGLIRALFSYPFDWLKCHRVTANVAEDNEPSKRLLAGLGFQLEGRRRKAIGGTKDILLFGMLKEECRWLNA